MPKNEEQLNECSLLRNELDISFGIISQLNMDMDFDQVLDDIIMTIKEKVNIDHCNFAFIDENEQLSLHRIKHSKFVQKYKAPADYLENLFTRRWNYKLMDSWLCRVARENRELFIPDASHHKLKDHEKRHVDKMGITGWYGLPIICEGRTLGVMTFVNYGAPLMLKELDKELIRRRVLLVGRVLSNFRLYREIKDKNHIISQDLQLARRIQKNLIPQKISGPHELKIAACYIPMQEVGGDYFDYHNDEENNSLNLLITDASGHGVPAAFITSMVKMAYRSEKIRDILQNPGKILKELNRSIFDHLAGNFVTACCCYINLPEKKMILAGASHPPVYVLHKNGKVSEALAKGKALGFFPDAAYEEKTADLTDVRRILLYTDGLSEAENPAGVQFNDLIPMLLSDYAAMNAAELKEQLLVSLKKHAGSAKQNQYDDDVAFLIVDF